MLMLIPGIFFYNEININILMLTERKLCSVNHWAIILFVRDTVGTLYHQQVCNIFHNFMSSVIVTCPTYIYIYILYN